MNSSKKSKGNSKNNNYGSSSKSGWGNKNGSSKSSLSNFSTNNSKSSSSKSGASSNSSVSSGYKRSMSTPSSSSSSKSDKYSSKPSSSSSSYARSNSSNDGTKSSLHSYPKPREQRSQSYNSVAGGVDSSSHKNKKMIDDHSLKTNRNYSSSDSSAISFNKSKTDKKLSDFGKDNSGWRENNKISCSSKPMSSYSGRDMLIIGNSSNHNGNNSSSTDNKGVKRLVIDKLVPKSQEKPNYNSPVDHFRKNEPQKATDSFSLNHQPKCSPQYDNQNITKMKKNAGSHITSSLFGANMPNAAKVDTKGNQFDTHNSIINGNKGNENKLSKGNKTSAKYSSDIWTHNGSTGFDKVISAVHNNKQHDMQHNNKLTIPSSNSYDTNLNNNKVINTPDLTRNIKNLESFKTKSPNTKLSLTLFSKKENNKRAHKNILEEAIKINSLNIINRDDNNRTISNDRSISTPHQNTDLTKTKKPHFSNQDSASFDNVKVIGTDAKKKLKDCGSFQINGNNMSVLKPSSSNLNTNSINQQVPERSSVGSLKSNFSSNHQQIQTSSTNNVNNNLHLTERDSSNNSFSSKVNRDLTKNSKNTSSAEGSFGGPSHKIVQQSPSTQRIEPMQYTLTPNITDHQELKFHSTQTKSANKGLGFLSSFNNLSQVMGLGPLKKPPKRSLSNKSDTDSGHHAMAASTSGLAIQSSSLNQNAKLEITSPTRSTGFSPEIPPGLPKSKRKSNSEQANEHSRNIILSSLIFPNAAQSQGSNNLFSGLNPASPFALFGNGNARRKTSDRSFQERSSSQRSSRNRNQFVNNSFTPLGLSAQGPVSRRSIQHEEENNSNTNHLAMTSAITHSSLINNNPSATDTREDITSRGLIVKLDDFQNTYDRAMQSIKNGDELATDGNYSQACVEFEVGLKLMDFILESRIEQFEMTPLHKTICTSIQEAILLNRKSALEGFSDSQAGILSPHRYASSAPSELEDVPTAPPTYDDVLREDLEKTFFAGGCDVPTQEARASTSPTDLLIALPSAPPEFTRMGTPPPSYTIDHSVVSSEPEIENISYAYDLSLNQQHTSPALSSSSKSNETRPTSPEGSNWKNSEPAAVAAAAKQNFGLKRVINNWKESKHDSENKEENKTTNVASSKIEDHHEQQCPPKATDTTAGNLGEKSTAVKIEMSPTSVTSKTLLVHIDSNTKVDLNINLNKEETEKKVDSSAKINQSESTKNGNEERKIVSNGAQTIRGDNYESKSIISTENVSKATSEWKVSLQVDDIKIFFFNETISSCNLKLAMIIREEIKEDGGPGQKRLEVGEQLWTLNLDPTTTKVLRTIDEDYIFQDANGKFMGVKLGTKVKFSSKESLNEILKASCRYQSETKMQSQSVNESIDVTKAGETSPKEKSTSFHFHPKEFSRRSFRAVQSATNAIARSFTNIRGGSTVGNESPPAQKLEGEMMELQVKGKQLQIARQNKTIEFV